MDPHEEQEQEIEVLRSIYPDELTVLSPTHFTIYLNLETSSDRKHALLLDVKYPPSYPEVAPGLDIRTVQVEDDSADYEDLDDDDNDAPEQYVSLAEGVEFERPDLAELLDKINEEAEMNIGIPSIFAVAAILKDEAELLFQRKVDQAQKEYDDELLAREAVEQKKFNGTKVTQESFTQWRNEFRAEMKVEARDKERFDRMHNGKMTGREIFEKGLAGEFDDEL
ncbi:RWD-domain-containing protein, partial [Metschnikowia bicuspidata var. bicuspidata NRRL YB-4993]